MEEDEIQLEDTLILSSGHSIIQAQPLGEGATPPKVTKDTIAKFGLFGGGNNYGTFYPDATKESWTPKDDEFIEPTFRLLSNVIVSKNYNPTEFPSKVLKESMHMLVGQTVNCDHETDILNAIGSVKDVFWQEAYTTDDGVKVPAGINGVLKIDAKANPRIARGIMMDPPSIHSNSVTVRFGWKPSHQFDDMREFWEKLGTYDEKGEMIRRIATKIMGYMETSLVWHGADPFAQKQSPSGRIVLPNYASSYYDTASNSEKKEAKVTKSILVHSEDFKSLAESFVEEPVEVQKEAVPQEPVTNQDETKQSSNTNQNSQKMDQDTLELTSQLIVLLGLSEELGKDPKAIVSSVTELKEKLEASQLSNSQLTEKVEALTKENESLSALAKIGEDHLASFREQTVNNYKKLNGEKVDDAILKVLGDEATPYAVLKTLNDTYSQALEDKFPMSCKDCGSNNVTRGSYVPQKDEDGFNEKPEGDRNIINSVLKKRKNNK